MRCLEAGSTGPAFARSGLAAAVRTGNADDWRLFAADRFHDARPMRASRNGAATGGRHLLAAAIEPLVPGQGRGRPETWRSGRAARRRRLHACRIDRQRCLAGLRSLASGRGYRRNRLAIAPRFRQSARRSSRTAHIARAPWLAPRGRLAGAPADAPRAVRVLPEKRDRERGQSAAAPAGGGRYYRCARLFRSGAQLPRHT